MDLAKVKAIRMEASILRWEVLARIRVSQLNKTVELIPQWVGLAKIRVNQLIRMEVSIPRWEVLARIRVSQLNKTVV